MDDHQITVRLLFVVHRSGTSLHSDDYATDTFNYYSICWGEDFTNSAMSKVVGSENGLVMILYDVNNTGETIPGIGNKSSKQYYTGDTAPPFRLTHCSRLVKLMLECRHRRCCWVTYNNPKMILCLWMAWSFIIMSPSLFLS